MSRPHILVVGGAGVFGSRLARLLARRQVSGQPGRTPPSEDRAWQKRELRA